MITIPAELEGERVGVVARALGTSPARIHQLRNPERHAARTAITMAVKGGLLPRASELRCVDCGSPAEEYDHHLGYAPAYIFAVMPRCVSCHSRRAKLGCPPSTQPVVADCSWIKEHRLRLGLTQTQLGEKVGCNQSSIAHWELGAAAPSAKHLRALTIVFQLDAVPYVERYTKPCPYCGKPCGLTAARCRSCIGRASATAMWQQRERVPA